MLKANETVVGEMMLFAGDASVEVTRPNSSATTSTVSTVEDAQDPDDEQKLIHELLSRLEPPVVRLILHHLTVWFLAKSVVMCCAAEMGSGRRTCCCRTLFLH